MNGKGFDVGLSWAFLESLIETEGGLRTEILPATTVQGHLRTGVDEGGLRHLLLPISDRAPEMEDHVSAAVQLRTVTLVADGGEGRYLDLVCNRSDLSDLFAAVANEVVAAASNAGDNPGLATKRVLARWRELLEPGHLLGGDAQVGLVGELLALREISSDTGWRVAVWTGPGGGRHDLCAGYFAMEVKASTAKNRRIVRVHGHRQLLPPEGTDLFLLWIRLEETASGGVALPELVRGLRHDADDPGLFMQLLAQRGYRESDAPVYAHRRLAQVERRVYRVDGAFPRIVPASFDDGDLPPGTGDLSYSIDLSNEPPHPLDDSVALWMGLREGR